MPTNSKETDSQIVFGRTNYVIIIIACITIIIGFVLMAGDSTTEMNYQPDIFSIRRIIIAPMVCLTGYLAVIIGIMWKPK